MKLNGIGASNGIVIAKAYKLEEPEINIVERTGIDVEVEKIKFKNAISKSEEELEIIKEKTRINIDDAHADIFDAHIQIINDPELISSTEQKIENDKVNADFAFSEISNMFVQMFENMDNEYLRERAADIKDVSKRIISHILGLKISDPTLIDEEVVVIAEDLTPSDTAQLDKKYVLAFATDIGGRTSHSAIMARSLEIPAVVGAKVVTEKIAHGDLIILDGIQGEIIIEPSEEEIVEYKKKQIEYNEQKELLKKFKDMKSLTKDGFEVEMVANIGAPDDVAGVLANGGEGVGLYRTEFLYMGTDKMPSEEEQYVAYKAVLESMEGKPVVIRTLDIGGDKELPYLDMPNEMNPFLGHRAIRLCLERTDIFRVQLRALLRASIYGNLKIMFPMIATINEFKEAKAILMDVKEELIKEGKAVSDKIEVGIMVEIPAVAILADQFAKVVDFFSIGTNDLIQYTFAADRMNERVSYLYQPFNPSLLRLIKMVIDAAHKEGKWAGMCGEMAGETLAVPLLLGMGLDEFSMSATSILAARHLLSKLDRNEAKEIAEKALNMNSNEEVIELVKEYISEGK